MVILPAYLPRSGAAARKFRHDTMAGNIGINIGIAAPMAFFPFSGWKESFFGDLHGQSTMLLNFIPRPKWLLNDGMMNGQENFNLILYIMI